MALSCGGVDQRRMRGVVTAISVLGFYLEVVLQLTLLFFQPADGNGLDTALLVILTCLIALSVTVTNLASLLLACRASHDQEGEARGGRACLALHVTQLGLAWRAQRLLLSYGRVGYLQLTSLRLVHAALTSFPFVVLQGRLLLLTPVHETVTPLRVLTLLVTLASSSAALCLYTYRHQLHKATREERDEGERVERVTCSNRRGHVGLLVMVLGTVLCLAARLGAFAVLSAQHGLWALVPFSLHFLLHTAVFISCRRRTGLNVSGHSAETLTPGQNVLPHQTSAACKHEDSLCIDESTYTPTAAVKPKRSSSVSSSTSVVLSCPVHTPGHSTSLGCHTPSIPIHTKTSIPRMPHVTHKQVSPTDTLCADTFTTAALSNGANTPMFFPPSQSKDASYSPPTCQVLHVLAKCYLNTVDLVEDGDRDDNGKPKCRHVLYYSLLLVQNLAMTAAWLLPSSMDYNVKLGVTVALLAAFLLALVLKFAGCSCVAPTGAGDGDDGGCGELAARRGCDEPGKSLPFLLGDGV